MPNISLTDVSLAYGARVLLDSVSLSLSEKTRAALAGVNGAGKTTLMRILSGQQMPDSGRYFLSQGWKVGYMSQAAPIDLTISAYQEAERAYREGFAIEEQIAALDLRATNESLEERSQLHDALIYSGFYEKEGIIDATLRGLGFTATQFSVPLGSLSSGWRMRAALARILLEQPDFLLLDEPSNYLDIKASDWLIDWLKRYAGGYLLVSHDRYFLDQTTRETYELFCGRVKHYVGSYTQYEAKREHELEILIEQKKRQDERIEQVQQFINKFRAKASKAGLVQSRIKELEKIEIIKLPENLQTVSFHIPVPPTCGERVIYVEDLSKKFGKRTIFSGLTMLVSKGEKVVLIGENGAGKSTLMRILSGRDKEFEGFMKLGTGVQVGYFSEETHEPLTCQTVLEEVELSAPLSMQAQVRDLLATFLFSGDDVYKPIAGLSGGEKARLLLLKIFLKPFNLLLLDEPTNHLDIVTKDALLNALKKYPGTLIFVSHDRFFIEKLAQYVLHVKEEPRYYPGDYVYATEQINKTNLPRERQNAVMKTMQQEVSQTRHSREKVKKNSAEAKRKKKQEEQVLAEIAQWEAKQQEIEAQLGNPEIYIQAEKVKELTDILKQTVKTIEDLYAQWESL